MADAQELTRLALAASERNDSEAAIGYLKQAAVADNTIAIPHFLLGAEYAQIGVMDRAIESFTQALQRDPGLATARFQLGLLHLTNGHVPEAEQAWKPLEQLGEREPLNLFQAGMMALARDEFARARELLAAGIALNTTNPALNADMAKVIERIENASSTATPAESHVLVSAYRDR